MREIGACRRTRSSGPTASRSRHDGSPALSRLGRRTPRCQLRSAFGSATLAHATSSRSSSAVTERDETPPLSQRRSRTVTSSHRTRRAAAAPRRPRSARRTRRRPRKSSPSRRGRRGAPRPAPRRAAAALDAVQVADLGRGRRRLEVHAAVLADRARHAPRLTCGRLALNRIHLWACLDERRTRTSPRARGTRAHPRTARRSASARIGRRARRSRAARSGTASYRTSRRSSRRTTERSAPASVRHHPRVAFTLRGLYSECEHVSYPTEAGSACAQVNGGSAPPLTPRARSPE